MSKKDEIMEIALDLFSEQGYEACGIASVVEGAGVSKPTMYHYFGSKEGLLASIYERYFSELMDLLKNCNEDGKDIIRLFQNIVRIYYQFSKTYPKFFWLSSHLRKSPMKSKSREIVQKFYEEEEQWLTEKIQEVSLYHTNLLKKETFLAISFLSFVNGYLEFRLSREMDLPEEEEVLKLTKQFLYGIFSL